jgi:hypothetical protein
MVDIFPVGLKSKLVADRSLASVHAATQRGGRTPSAIRFCRKRRLLRRRDISDSVCLVGRTEDDDGTSASRTGCVVLCVLARKAYPADHPLRSIDRFVDDEVNEEEGNG